MQQDLMCVRVADSGNATRRNLDKGEILGTLRPGQIDHQVWLVETGGLAISAIDPELGSLMLDVLGRSSCFSTWDTMPTRAASEVVVFALVPSTIYQIPRDDFLQMVAADRDLSNQVVLAKARQHGVMMSRAAIMRQHDPLRKLAGTILYLSDQLGEGCPVNGGNSFRMNQHMVASVADLSRQTVNRELSILRDANLVHVERSFICVLDADGLHRVASGRKPEAKLNEKSVCRWRHPEEIGNCHFCAPAVGPVA
ncbi:MAG: Crp/Fnr family transcriptional regulator [Gemmatimonadota bacterium]|nr:Crp/Fnr family transcriptional regulator [Gemmatimonadota bacterium]